MECYKRKLLTYILFHRAVSKYLLADKTLAAMGRSLGTAQLILSSVSF